MTLTLYDGFNLVRQNLHGSIEIQAAPGSPETVNIGGVEYEVRTSEGIPQNIVVFVTPKSHNFVDLDTGSIQIIDRDVLLKRFGKI